MRTFENRNNQQIKTFQKDGGTWFTCLPTHTLVLQTEFLENRTEIWIAEFDNVGRELQRWNVSFVQSLIWEK